MHPRSSSARQSLRSPWTILSVVAVLALLFTMVQTTVARAAGAPPAGMYTGSSSAYTGATVEFEIDDAGNLVSFDTESYVYCGAFPMPTPMQWTGIPPTPVTADEPFDLSWSFGDDPGSAVHYTLEDVVISSDGTATGEGYASMDFCQGGRFDFTASNDGGGGPEPDPTPDPEPGEPTIVLDPASLEEDEIRVIGTRVTATGFPADADLDFTVTRVRDDRQVHGSTRGTDANGAVDFAFRQDLSAVLSGEPYDLTLSTVVDGEEIQDSARLVVRRQWEFNRVYEQPMTASPDTVSESELATSGVTFSSTGFRDGQPAALTIDGQPAGETVTGADGSVSIDFTSASLGTGEHEAMLLTEYYDDNTNRTRHRWVAVGTFTVTEDPAPTPTPTEDPTPDPTPTNEPEPTQDPTPTQEPTVEPTEDPSPTPTPTQDPTPSPTADPSPTPTEDPTPDPTPTQDPTPDPTPTVEPTEDPTPDPTQDPTVEPTEDPTVEPTEDPTVEPTEDPTEDPTADPTGEPTPEPTDDPGAPQIPESAPSEDDLDPAVEGGIVAPAEAEQGEAIEVHVEGADPGADVGVWFFSDPTYLGTVSVSPQGTVDVSVPQDAPFGEHRLAVWQSQDSLVGWTTLEVVAPDAEPDPTSDPTEEPTTDPAPSPDPTNDPSESPSGEPTEGPSDGPTSQPTDDPADVDPSLTVDPDVIAVSDFVREESGVTLSVDGLAAGTAVSFDIAAASGQNIEPATLSAVANEEGIAATSVHGVDPESASAYVGEYSVHAHVDDGSDFTGAFTVVPDEDAPGGGGDGDDHTDGDRDGSGDGGDRLPRTGQSTGALLATGLLLAGAGAGLLAAARRRTV